MKIDGSFDVIQCYAIPTKIIIVTSTATAGMMLAGIVINEIYQRVLKA